MDTELEQVIERWLATWAHIRDIAVLERDGWPVMQVGSPSRETELVCVDPGVESFTDLLRHVEGDPRAMLTVAATDVGPYLTTRLPDGVRLDRDDEALMSVVLHDDPIPPLAPDLTFRWDVDDHRTTYSVESGDTLAASGSVGVIDGWATFDAVETMPAFQRQGLGGHVMATLTVQAMGRGATHGVLAASGQGRGLYQAIGWQHRLELLSFMGT
ncbi:GNAT family N-acetyltransferase [Aeromicrobium stalagmiti]|uniref:GNAT family N-acetyltransferase n=1 Tax=Aeromicrobium stalagmiti TaxID=2738988 RepID=UPI00156A5622|nr:GNAT family N-acetyltransferase [Aeromicrobium stalagmiti]NRQ51418.1 GNAT family N-acetyltransferase [Aeromicrobium stalagmiti]